MKTLLLTYANGRYDIVMQNGHSVTLDSTNPSQRRTFIQQRFEKCLRSKPNFFDPSYGGDISSAIGTRQGTAITRIVRVFERINQFFRKTISGCGNVGISNVVTNSITQDGKVLCTVYSASEKIPLQIENK